MSDDLDNKEISRIPKVESSHHCLGYSSLSKCEFYINGDVNSVQQELNVVIDLMKTLTHCWETYMNDLKPYYSKNLQLPPNIIANRKARLSMAATPIIESILEWFNTSEISILFPAFVQLAYGDKSKEILHFLPAEHRQQEPLDSVRFNAIVGKYEGNSAKKFSSLFGFELGVPKKPKPLGKAFFRLQANIVHTQEKLFDSRMSMYHGSLYRLHYLEAWTNFFDEFRNKLIDDESVAKQWQQKLIM